MAAHLRQPQLSIDMETVVQTALSRGYTVQGEMFSGNKGYELFVSVTTILKHKKFPGSKSFLIAFGNIQFVLKAE